MASNTGNSFDAGIERARSKEQTNQRNGGPPADIRGGIIKNVIKNPTSNGKIGGGKK